MKNIRENVNAIKNHTASAITTVHAISFAIFDVGYIILDRFLKIYLPDIWWGDVLKAIFVAGAYIVIYQLVKCVYNRFISYSNPKFDIEGKWYHVHIPNDFFNNNIINRASLSAGITRIRRDLNDFTFSSENYDFTVETDFEGNMTVKSNGRLRTSWWTETSEICEGNDMDIVEIYKAHSERRQNIEIDECPVCHSKFEDKIILEEASDHRFGIHLYKIDTEKGLIVCDYSDCFPSLKSGKMYLYKNKEDRDNKIIEYFKDNHKKAVL